MRPLFAATVLLCAFVSFAQESKPTDPKERTEAEKKTLLAEQQKWGEETAKLRAAGKLKEAIQAAEKMLAAEIKLYGELHDEPIGSLDQIAECHEGLEQFAEAKKVRQRILEVEMKRFGKEHWKVTDARLAIENLDLLAKLTPEGRKEVLRATDLNMKGAQLFDTNPKKALPLLQEAITIRKKQLGENHPDFATSLNNLALVYDKIEEHAKAEPLFLQAKEIRKKQLGENHPDYASSLNDLAGLYRAMGEHDKAVPLFLQAKEIRKKQLGENHPDYVGSLNDLAGLYRAMGDHDKAVPLLFQVKEIEKKQLGENHLDYATSLDNLAWLYRTMGETAKAEPLFLEAKEIRKKQLGENHPDYATSLNYLALSYQEMGEYTKAEPLYLQAKEIRKKQLGENHPDYAATLNNLAGLYLEMRGHAKAEPFFLQAKEIHKKQLGENHPRYAGSLNNLGLLYLGMGEHAKAESHYLQAKEIYKKQLGENHLDYATSLNNLALLYQAMGENAKAEPLYLQAKEIHKNHLGESHPLYANCLNNLAELYHAMGEHDKAELNYREAVRIVSDHLERTSEIQTESSQLATAKKNQRYWHNMLWGTAKNQSTAVYESLFRIRGAITMRQMFLRAVRQAKPETKPLVEELQKVSREMNRLVNNPPDPEKKINVPKNLDELNQLYEKLQRELAQKSDAFAEYQKRQKATLADLQKLLPEDAVLIDYVTYKDQLAAFVVTRSKVERFELGEMKPIETAIDRFRTQLDRESPLTGRKDDPAAVLRDKLLTPLLPALAEKKWWLISPDQAICRLPFVALPGKDNQKYLIEEVALVTMPVPQMLFDLVALKTPPRACPSVFLMGDVDFNAVTSSPYASGLAPTRPGGHLECPPLPGTKKEIEQIASTFKAAVPLGRVERVSGKEATQAALRENLGRFELVHLATHGFFAPKGLAELAAEAEEEEAKKRGLVLVPKLKAEGDFTGEPRKATGPNPGLLSGIVCAGANKSNTEGVLTALDIAELDLTKVDLAVLSACETGLGATAGGEGVFGLQRAFQLAGAKTTVTSLWEVDDIATQALMNRFYDQMLKQKRGRLESLRETQLWMLNEGNKIEGIRRGLKLRPKDGESAVPTEPGTAPSRKRLPPHFWAAFSLAGDWR